VFDCDVTELDAAETLAAATDAHAARTAADLHLIELSLHLADLYPDPATIPGHVSLPGGERGWHHGGPGCPGFAEFAAAEFGAAIGRSAGSAAVFIGQSLALRHRFPHILAAIRSGHGEPWKARNIATLCLTLSLEAAAIVDRRVARILDSVTPLQLEKLVKAAIKQADPEAARATADQKAKERGVYAGHTDEHGTTTLHIHAATGAVIRFKATLRQIADALAELGYTETLQQRMAMAIDIISDPALAHELLAIAQHLTTPTATPQPPAGDAAPDTPATNHHPNLVGDTTPGPDTDENAEPGPTAETGQHMDLRPNAELAPDVEADRDAGSAGLQPPSDWYLADEPGMDEEADRDPPHPSDPMYDTRPGPPTPSARAGRSTHDTESAEPADPATDAALRRTLAGKLNAIKQNAYPTGIGSTGQRPASTTVYVHLTDQSLLAGEGVTRVERFGPVFTARLEELLGHGQIIIKPVIDLNQKLNVNAYEIPRRIREHVKLTHPVEQFPYGAAETTNSTDLDHIRPYDFNATGPPGQTSTTNLAPLRRYSHRVKTHGGWTVKRLDNDALEWTTKHGYKFVVDHDGTHRITKGSDESR
jgi:hypothetical protein